MLTAFFITHPEVTIEPTTPVPQWRLSDRGIRRMRDFAASPALRSLTAVWASTEAKAIEAAGLLAAGFGLPVGVHAGLAENDRSSTGFLPPAEFGAVADMFFSAPDRSVRGWERASDAQRRVVAAVHEIVANHEAGDIALVAHGGVGTLLLCHLLGVPISRSRDQPGQGHVFAFDAATRRIIHDWRPITGSGQACDGPS